MSDQNFLHLFLVAIDELFEALIASANSDKDLVTFERTIAPVTSNQILILLDMHNGYSNIHILD